MLELNSFLVEIRFTDLLELSGCLCRKARVPDARLCVFFGGDEDLIEFFYAVIFSVKYTQYPESVARNLFDGISKEIEKTEVFQVGKLASLFKIFDVVSLQIKSLKAWKLENFVFNRYKVVVAKV